jgi:hypothetical protein
MPIHSIQQASEIARHAVPCLFQSTNKLDISSGDEYAYEYVTHERTYFVDTSHQRGMLVLPSAAREGFKIVICDSSGSWHWHPLVIHRNGGKIMGLEEHLVCDEPFSVFGLTYAASTGLGWVISQDILTAESVANAKQLISKGSTR